VIVDMVDMPKKNIVTKTLIGVSSKEIDALVKDFRKDHFVIAVQTHVLPPDNNGVLLFVYVVFYEDR
jgi:hypothetical protein